MKLVYKGRILLVLEGIVGYDCLKLRTKTAKLKKISTTTEIDDIVALSTRYSIKRIVVDANVAFQVASLPFLDQPRHRPEG